MIAPANYSIDSTNGPRISCPAGSPVHRDYYLHDLAGRPLGTIAAPERRPEVGPAAPTVYLRRAS
jgi:hypothetical protein